MDATNKTNEATVMHVRTDLGMGGDEIELELIPVIDLPWDGVIIEYPDVSVETEPTYASE